MRHSIAGAILFLATLALVGCASTVVMKDPTSGQLAQCQSTVGGFFPVMAAQQIDTCVAGYEKAGWARQ